jgi:hypothetical protein
MFIEHNEITEKDWDRVSPAHLVCFVHFYYRTDGVWESHVNGICERNSMFSSR